MPAPFLSRNLIRSVCAFVCVRACVCGGGAFFVANSSVLTAELNADDSLALKVLAVKSRDFVAYGRPGARDERNQT